jgi:hypothetical protein
MMNRKQFAFHHSLFLILPSAFAFILSILSILFEWDFRFEA